MKTQSPAIAAFEDEEGAKKCQWSPEAGKGKKMDSPLMPPGRNVTPRCLEFSPMRLMMGFFFFFLNF